MMRPMFSISIRKVIVVILMSFCLCITFYSQSRSLSTEELDKRNVVRMAMMNDDDDIHSANIVPHEESTFTRNEFSSETKGDSTIKFLGNSDEEFEKASRTVAVTTPKPKENHSEPTEQITDLKFKSNDFKNKSLPSETKTPALKVVPKSSADILDNSQSSQLVRESAKRGHSEYGNSWVVNSPENLRELQNFAGMMSMWPSDKPKAAIYFLAEAKKLKALRSALERLYTYFLMHFRYPVIIFHEKGFTNETKRVVREFLPTNDMIFFQEVKFSLPKDKIIGALISPKDVCSKRSISYRHMCRFNAFKVYEQPIFSYIDYYWRLDTDSKILKNIQYDVFKRLENEQKIHGYIWTKLDNPRCVIGLWDVVKNYIAAQGIKAQFFDRWPDRKVYFNNFEISKVDFWKRQEVKDFLHHLDDLGGIYYLRWGDNPIHAIAVAIFARENETLYYDNVAYAHKNVVLHR